MNWEAAGAIGERVGVLAVVTVIYLANQVRYARPDLEFSKWLFEVARIEKPSE